MIILLTDVGPSTNITSEPSLINFISNISLTFSIAFPKHIIVYRLEKFFPSSNSLVSSFLLLVLELKYLLNHGDCFMLCFRYNFEFLVGLKISFSK